MTQAGQVSSAVQRLWKAHAEKIKYLVVGVFNTVVGYVFFLLMLATVARWVGVLSASPVTLLSLIGRNSYLAAQWATWVVMVVVSTSMFKFFVFHHDGRWLHQIGRGYLVYLPAQAISTVVLYLTVQVLHLTPQIGQLVTIASTTVFSYLGHKYFTFRIPLDTGEVPPEDLLA